MCWKSRFFTRFEMISILRCMHILLELRQFKETIFSKSNTTLYSCESQFCWTISCVFTLNFIRSQLADLTNYNINIKPVHHTANDWNSECFGRDKINIRTYRVSTVFGFVSGNKKFLTKGFSVTVLLINFIQYCTGRRVKVIQIGVFISLKKIHLTPKIRR